MGAERLRNVAWAALVALSAIAVWPPAQLPFSSAKLVVLAAGVLVLAFTTKKLELPRFPRACLAVWAGGLALSTLIRGGSFEVVLRESLALVLVALSLSAAPGWMALAALRGTAGIVAVLALAQAFGADPFAHFGFFPAVAGERMRVYATFGNPDFLAAWLVPALWTCAEKPEFRRDSVLLLLGAAALAACASFGTVLSLLCGGAAYCVAVRRPPRLPVLVAAVLALAFLASAAGSRSLSTRVFGRAALARIAAVNAASSPLVGHGPGAFRASYPGWRDDPMLDPLQDHVHDDWLERAVEQGIPAALAFLALVLGGLAAAVRRRAGWAAAGLASLAARACVDFPFARVPELILLAVFLGFSYAPPPAPEATP